MKTVVRALAAIALLSACSRQTGSDMELRAKIVGTWTTADVPLPDGAKVSDIITTFAPNGAGVSRYTITREGNSRPQTTSGIWKIECGFMIEEQTNVDGMAIDGESHRAASMILRLNDHEMVVSNWFRPYLVFHRR